MFVKNEDGYVWEIGSDDDTKPKLPKGVSVASVEDFETQEARNRALFSEAVAKRGAERHAQIVADLQAGNFSAIATALTGFTPKRANA